MEHYISYHWLIYLHFKNFTRIRWFFLYVLLVVRKWLLFNWTYKDRIKKNLYFDDEFHSTFARWFCLWTNTISGAFDTKWPCWLSNWPWITSRQTARWRPSFSPISTNASSPSATLRKVKLKRAKNRALNFISFVHSKRLPKSLRRKPQHLNLW